MVRSAWLVSLVGVCGLATGSGALAVAPCPNLRSMEDVYEALNSKDHLTVLKGLQCGLRSDESGARGLVIQRYLSDGATPGAGGSNLSAINVIVDAYPGDKDASAIIPKLPSFSIWNVHWSPDGHQFAGSASFCCSTAASGNLIGDALTISYQGWPLPDDKGGTRTGGCTLSLAPNEAGTALEGPLRCTGLPYRFDASMGL